MRTKSNAEFTALPVHIPNQLLIALIRTVENFGAMKTSLRWSTHYEKVTGLTLKEKPHL